MKNKIRVLIVDDEKSIVEFLKMGLEAEGFDVFVAFDGVSGIRLAKEIQPHILILDVMLPGKDGYAVCRELKQSIHTTIIMLSAKDGVDDCIDGLSVGADDYMSKPFSFKELLARINARLRTGMLSPRGQDAEEAFVVNHEAHEVYYKKNLLDLSLTEYKLLCYFLSNRGIALSKQRILDHVWGIDFMGDENIVEVYVRYLRNKLGDEGFSIIRTLRGVGYKVD